MTPEQYQDEACRTESIIDNIEGYDKIRLIHGLLGLTSESGEIADTIKRWVYYRQPLDEENLKEEIGDLLWYVALICNTLAMTIEECMEANIRKLKKRFPDKFDVELAKEENRNRESEMAAINNEVVISNPIVNEEDYQLGKSVGFCEGVKLAKDIADMLDGQDRKQALRMIEQREALFMKGDN